MFKIKYIAISLTYFLYSLSHFTCQQSNAQNSITQASIVPELRTCNVEARFRQGRGIRDQIANIHWITEKAKEFQKNIYFFIGYTNAFIVDHNKLWKILKELTSRNQDRVMHWRRKWQPTPVFLPGESQGWGSLVGCHLQGRTESDSTEATQQQQYVLHVRKI